MSKKKILAVVAVGLMLALAGCAGDEANDGGEELAEDTGEDVSAEDVGNSAWYEMAITEKNQAHLVREQPPFRMDSSLERQNLIERYKHLNDENNVHHVYLMSNDGKVIAYFTARGKVSSVNSKLTNDRQIIADNRCLEATSNEGDGACFQTVESPQMDGSYGENGSAIFFFTTGGEYVEWNGKYVVSEEPKNIQTAVSLTEEVGEEGEVTDESGNEVNPEAQTEDEVANESEGNASA